MRCPGGDGIRLHPADHVGRAHRAGLTGDVPAVFGKSQGRLVHAGIGHDLAFFEGLDLPEPLRTIAS
jgi:hypothetical protein